MTKAWLKSKVIAVLRHEHTAEALGAAQVALQAGLQTLEVTFTTPKADSIITQLREKFPDKTVGAGSITTLAQAKSAKLAGAHFFVSPHFDPELGKWFIDQGLPYVPGGLTPSELKAIQNQGHYYQKVFPVLVIGPQGLKNILAPLPELNPIVTGGVELANAKSYLDAGAKAVCVGGSLFSKDFMKAQNSKQLTEECQKWMRL